jgi:nuclear pore complex protein Nup205
LNARLESLKYERRHLAVLLLLIARHGYIGASEIKMHVEWLATNPNHAMTYYLLTATLSAFDPLYPESINAQALGALARDKTLMTSMTKLFGPSTTWAEPGLKATLLLKWTLFLTEFRHLDPSLEQREGFHSEVLETQIRNAVQGDAFSYMALMVIQLQKRHGSSAATSFASSMSLSPEQEQLRELPVDDFIPAVFEALEVTVRSLITYASSELRKIKQKQEDVVLASVRSDRARMFHSQATQPMSMRFPSGSGPDTEKPSQAPPRSDIAMLYSFIGLLYNALPAESALQFWGAGAQTDTQMSYVEYVETTAGKLPNFLQWAVWSIQGRDIDMSMALYDMLAGLAKGQQCSELAYNFMARGSGEVISGSSLPSSSSSSYNGVSWTGVFGLLESWASAGVSRQGTVIQQNPVGSHFGTSTSSVPWQSQVSGPTQQLQQHQLELGSSEVLLAQSFLRLLSTVVTHSVSVRIAISGNNQFRSIPTLVSLIPLGIPLELKGAIFETLAAFCEPGAGVPGVEICKAIWTLMERLEVINVRGGQSGGFGQSLLTSGKGVEVELEEVETVYKLYPSTIPFLKLLSTLIHTSKRIPFKDRVVDAEPVNTIPETLGQPYRLPGIGPFVTFVVDHVFAQIPNREYLCPSDRWRTNDLCLCFIERALASYDLESLVDSGENQSWTGENIVPLLVHPGYDAMKRILTNSPLQASLLSYIVEGLEGFEKHYAEEEPFFHSTIVRVLRIVSRVLEIQDIFLDILIPVLSEFNSAPIIGTVHARSDFTRFDQALSFGPQFIPSLAAYVAYPTYPELVLLSIKIFSSLASSNAFPNLTAFIERSRESDRILTCLPELLDLETDEDVPTTEATTESFTGAGAPDLVEALPVLGQAMKLAVLDLFIHNTGPGRDVRIRTLRIISYLVTHLVSHRSKIRMPWVPVGLVYTASLTW